MAFEYNYPDEGVGSALIKMGVQSFRVNCQTGEVEDPQLTEEQLAELEAIRQRDVPWDRVKGRRNARLAATDVWALSDRTMTPEQIAYRQALRDITKQSDPFNITWPTKPAD